MPSETHRRTHSAPQPVSRRALMAALGLPVLGLAVAQPRRAAAEAVPSLVFSGAIGWRNAGDEARLTLADLDALGNQTIRTTCPWYTDAQEFTGPLLTAVLGKIGASGEKLVATALNDYSVTLPISDAAAWSPIIASRHNGALMSVREKGPFMVMYPFDRFPEIKTELHYSRCIWQLKRVVVV